MWAVVISLFVALLFSGCSIPYPAEKRALIPRMLDSDYKEFREFAKQEIGRVIYARPIENAEQHKNEIYISKGQFAASKDKDLRLYVGIDFVWLERELVQVYIAELGYYGGWRKWTFNFFIFPNTTERIYIGKHKAEIDESQIMQNKEIIGNLQMSVDKIIKQYYLKEEGIIENLLDKPQYLNEISTYYKDFRVLHNYGR